MTSPLCTSVLLVEGIDWTITSREKRILRSRFDGSFRALVELSDRGYQDYIQSSGIVDEPTGSEYQSAVPQLRKRHHWSFMESKSSTSTLVKIRLVLKRKKETRCSGGETPSMSNFACVTQTSSIWGLEIRNKTVALSGMLEGDLRRGLTPHR